jgi:alpha-ribazole phosphatase/probable phosphoglycerate mutase
MIAYWALPEVFPAPKGVESVKSLVARSSSFLSELEKKPYGTVLVACHGGILRALCGYMEGRKNGILWRPKPKNCEVRVYDSNVGARRRIETFQL